jgi:Protein of unknown function (DUF2878)
MSKARLIGNFLAFQVAWFVCVWGGARGQVLIGVLWVAMTVTVHLALAPRFKPEAQLIAVVTLLGSVWESALVMLDLVRYPYGMFADFAPSLWIIAMWPLFATVLNLSLRWMQGRPITAAIFGLLGAPLSYWAGYRMGAIETPDLKTFLIVQGVGWAVLMPIVTSLAARKRD